MSSKIIVKCPHNKEVDCTEYQRQTHCNKCGWNPKVAKRRLAELRGELIEGKEKA